MKAKQETNVTIKEQPEVRNVPLSCRWGSLWGHQGRLFSHAVYRVTFRSFYTLRNQRINDTGRNTGNWAPRLTCGEVQDNPSALSRCDACTRQERRVISEIKAIHFVNCAKCSAVVFACCWCLFLKTRFFKSLLTEAANTTPLRCLLSLDSLLFSISV